MKKSLVASAFILLCITIAACYKEGSDVAPRIKKNTQSFSIRTMARTPDSPYYHFIPKDSANKMISSYLYSISSSTNDSDIQSLSINADSLRAYLSSNVGIKRVKLMFAHTLDFINGGGYGSQAGYQSGAFTIVIAAYDSSGNYVYMSGNKVIDHALPCPNSCPATGTAGSSLLY